MLACSWVARGARGRRGARDAHPDDWRHSRQEPPQSTEGTRVQQRTRNARRAQAMIANEDVSTRDLSIASGTYHLIAAGEDEIAKGDAWTVEITVLSKA